MTFRRFTLITYFIAVCLELIGHIWYLNWQPYTKPWLMPLLAIYFIANYSGDRRSWFYSVLAALLFSWLGDVLLLFQTANTHFFNYGLAAFLLAHIGYIYTNQQARIENYGTPLLLTQRVRYAATLAMAGFILVYTLFPHLESLKIPVILYAGTLISMTLTALYRYGNTATVSFWLVFLGAILFMISDSLLAINKFIEPLPLPGLWVMSTYLVAQFLLVRGFLSHLKAG